MKNFNCILIFLFFCSSAEQISLPFGTYFQPKTTETGEVLTIAAFTTDSSYFYLYDMSDRSIAVVDSTGVFLKKSFLQSIGRKTYIGDDFIVRKGEAIFLNAVDFRIEYFDMETGVLKKSLPYPHEIPGDNPKRRYRMITRIFLDESRIYLGNIHSVFLFDEKTVLQKKSTMKITKFASDKSIVLYHANNPVMKKTRQAKWSGKLAKLQDSKYPMFGKNIAEIDSTLFICTVTDTGITISHIEFAE